MVNTNSPRSICFVLFTTIKQMSDECPCCEFSVSPNCIPHTAPRCPISYQAPGVWTPPGTYASDGILELYITVSADQFPLQVSGGNPSGDGTTYTSRGSGSSRVVYLTCHAPVVISSGGREQMTFLAGPDGRCSWDLSQDATVRAGVRTHPSLRRFDISLSSPTPGGLPGLALIGAVCLEPPPCESVSHNGIVKCRGPVCDPNRVVVLGVRVKGEDGVERTVSYAGNASAQDRDDFSASSLFSDRFFFSISSTSDGNMTIDEKETGTTAVFELQARAGELFVKDLSSTPSGVSLSSRVSSRDMIPNHVLWLIDFSIALDPDRGIRPPI